jgi:hypothetical protein
MRKLWTDDERNYLIKTFPNSYTVEICDFLNRSYSSVSTQAKFLGLKKSESFKAIELQKQAERLKESGKLHRFSKGHVAHNKGKKMPEEIYKICSATMFKKGNEPHNTKFNGFERISKDGYVEVRVAKGEFILKHRKIWEDVHGATPDGHIVIFKDGNKQNIEIENLMMISKRDNMDRNTIHRYPEDLKGVIRLIGKLKKKINGKEQNK